MYTLKENSWNSIYSPVELLQLYHKTHFTLVQHKTDLPETLEGLITKSQKDLLKQQL